MKTSVTSLFFILIMAGCHVGPDAVMNNAALHASGIFIQENISSVPTLRIRESKVVETGNDSTYHVSGLVEGFSSYNTPVNVKQFTEIVHYLGGDPNVQKNWECIEIYVGNKKMK